MGETKIRRIKGNNFVRRLLPFEKYYNVFDSTRAHVHPFFFFLLYLSFFSLSLSSKIFHIVFLINNSLN